MHHTHLFHHSLDALDSLIRGPWSVHAMVFDRTHNAKLADGSDPFLSGTKLASQYGSNPTLYSA
jgi:hypothetical protein